ncbi:MAG: hypothetical protein E6Q97_16650 [Desulfurellales bacterium]|nr:MAG: hypothetical protein E6Q97_16650 [Desulfurellales bacterium]
MNDRDGNPIVVGDLYVVVGEALGEFSADRVALDTARPLVADHSSAGNPPTIAHVSTDLVPISSLVHDPVTVTDSSSVNLTLTGQDVTAAAIFGTTAGTVAEGNHGHAIGDVTDLEDQLDAINFALAGKQASDALLSALAALTTAADRLAYFTGVDTVALATFTAAARTFIAAADAASQRAALGLTPAGGLEQTGSNVQIADNGVTNAKLRDSAGVSVIGRAANSTGDPADITAASDGLVLRRTSSVVGFGTVDTAGITANAVTNTVLRDSAALSVIGRSANSTGDPADIAAGTDGHVLRRSGTTLAFGTLTPTASLAGITTDRLIGRDTAGTGAAEEITVGGNLEFTGSGGIQRGALTGAITASAGSGTTAFGSFKANSILMNMTNASGVPTAVDGADAAANMWAFLGGSYLLPAWDLSNAKLGSIAI